MHVDALCSPPTQVSAQALEAAREYLTPALLNHSIRSYAWAVAYAKCNQIDFDAELLFVSALLHDFGLVPVFDSEKVPFELASGHIARVFAAGAGWPTDRRDELHEVVAFHMSDSGVAPSTECELLRVATTFDIAGRRAEGWDAATVDLVLQALPRLGLGAEFIECLEAQRARKPTSAAAAALEAGVTARIIANPLDLPRRGAVNEDSAHR
jgi:hypothetical protein